MSEKRELLYEAIEKHEKEKERLEEKLEICDTILQSLYASRDALKPSLP